MASSSLALSNLRAFVILIVLAFHSVLAYLGSLPASAFPFDSPPYRWLAFPIVDSRRWFGFDLFCALQDVYLMSFMFLLSGLFVWPSLTRKGSATFLYDRLLRLGLPFALVVFLLMPVALYPTYRVTAVDPGVSAFWQHWLSLPFWPSGPPWFLWQLLAWNIAAALLHRLAPRWGEALARLSSSAKAYPVRYFAGLVSASAVAYVPLALAFGPWTWSEFGPFSLQISRPLHYAVYFCAGVGLGAYGIERGLLASDGMLARRWAAWLAAALVAFVLWMAATARIMGEGEAAALPLQFAASLGFVLACASFCFFFAAVFLRFAKKRWRMVDSLSENAYGMYLVHYVFVVWLQYALLEAPLFAVAKAAIVFGATLLLSWALIAGMRPIALGSRLLGARPGEARLPGRDGTRRPAALAGQDSASATCLGVENNRE